MFSRFLIQIRNPRKKATEYVRHSVLDVSTPQGSGTNLWIFSHWSHDGLKAQTVIGTAGTNSYTANFTSVPRVYTVTPLTTNVGQLAGFLEMTITTAAGCPWSHS